MTKKRLEQNIESFLSRIPDRWAVFFFICLSGALQFFRLGQRDFWYDEAYTGNLIRVPWNELLSSIVYDVHPPLYYILLKTYAALIGDGVVALRSFSVIWGIGCVVLVYAIGKEFFQKKTAVYAGLLASFLPFLIQFGQEARMYTQYAFLILLAFYLYSKSIKTGKLIYALGWGVSFGLACLTHYMALLFFPGFILLELLLCGITKQGIKRFIIGSVVTAFVFLPWLRAFIHQLFQSDERWAKPRPSSFSDIFLTLEIFLLGMPKGEMSAGAFVSNQLRGLTDSSLFLWVQGIFISLMSYSVILKEKRKGWIIVIFSIGFLIMTYAFTYIDRTFLYPRYVIPAACFLCILIAAWLSHIPRWGVIVFFIIYGTTLFLVQPVANSEGYNAFQKDLATYDSYRFYSLNTFDYMLTKYYVGDPERITLYNVGWPQYDSRSWPMIGYETKRTERFEDLKEDPHGIIIWNVHFPRDQRDDKNFDPTPFELIAKYKNIELYRYKR